MRQFINTVFFIPVILFFLLSGCSETETEDVGVEPSGVKDVETITTPPSVEADPEKVFGQLKQAFAGRLDNAGNFTALREITASRIYLDYLAAVYPTETPVTSLEEYFHIAAPDRERYIPFLAQFGIDEPTDEDIVAIHRLTLVYREINYMAEKFVFGPERAKNPLPDIILITNRIVVVREEPLVKAFLEQHHLNKNNEFSDSLEEFAYATLVEDARWMQEQMDIYGTDNGLLWCAIQNPTLMGEILLNFTSTELFLAWISTLVRGGLV